MSQPQSIADLNRIAQEMAELMTQVATSIAQLGVEGDADVQMATIKAANDKVLNRIREIYNLPAVAEG